MNKKFSWQGVIVVLISLGLMTYYTIIFRQARLRDLQQYSHQKDVLLNNQK